jgi:isopenicillin N synthase-like dioxygenase
MNTKSVTGLSFITHGVERIAMPNNNKGFQKMVKKVEEDFIRFTQEKPAYQDNWTFDLTTPSRLEDGGYQVKSDPDFGYTFRAGKSGKDHKHFMHDKDKILRRLLSMREVDISKYEEFLTELEKLQDCCFEQVIIFATQLDKILPGYNFAEKINKAHSLNTIRLIAYLPKPKGHVIAREHTDRNAITMHIYQSQGGLFLDLHDGSKYLYEQKNGSTVVFPGKKLQVLTGGKFSEVPVVEGSEETKLVGSGGLIRATSHYAQSFGGIKDMRVSMVYFSHISDVHVQHMK